MLRFYELHQWADLMEEVQQLWIVCLPSKVLLQHSVDAGLQDDVVVAGYQAHLQLDTSPVNTAGPAGVLHCAAASWEVPCTLPEGPGCEHLRDGAGKGE